MEQESCTLLIAKIDQIFDITNTGFLSESEPLISHCAANS